ncbi:MAG: M48 family metallopeptidase [Gemmatimonadales bacterium]
MANEGSLPSARPRKVLENVAAVTWEHPADRAALQALRAVPGFNEAVKKIVGYFGERGIRLIFQANAVQVGPRQFPRLHTLWTEVCTTMDWAERPPLFVSETPIVNASAVGVDHPFVVVNSGTLRLIDEDETRVLLGHELGHVMSGHALYRTVTLLILWLGLQNLPFLAGLALLPIKLALLEWYRKSELSSDRAGLLASQDPRASLQLFLRLAGGADAIQRAPLLQDMNLDAYLEQAREYEELGGPLDKVYKILNTLGTTHPFHTLRAAELQRWIDEGSYERVLEGEYTHRGTEERERPLTSEFGDAAKHYAREAKETVSQVADAAKRAASAFSDSLRRTRRGDSSGEADRE